MDLTTLPIAALPLPVPAVPSLTSVPSLPSAPDKSVPLALRFTLNATISAKANYYDLANTKRPPFDLRTALIWLCLCAHDNSVWWQPRSPEHRDGEDPAPLPLALDFAAWMRYIQDWQNAHFAASESAAAEALALRVWIDAHRTVCVPELDDDSTKKNAPASIPTGPSSTPASSPEAMSADGTTSSTASPSPPPIPSSTHGSAPMESPASAPPNTPAETPRSMPSSQPPPVPGEVFWVAELIGRHPLLYATGTHDVSGGEQLTDNIHEARHFPDAELCRQWIRASRRPDAWAARDHMCL